MTKKYCFICDKDVEPVFECRKKGEHVTVIHKCPDCRDILGFGCEFQQ